MNAKADTQLVLEDDSKPMKKSVDAAPVLEIMKKSYGMDSEYCYGPPMIMEEPGLGQLEATSPDGKKVMKLTSTMDAVTYTVVSPIESGVTVEFTKEQAGYWTLTMLESPRMISDGFAGPLRQGLIYSTQQMREIVCKLVNSYYIPLK